MLTFTQRVDLESDLVREFRYEICRSMEEYQFITLYKILDHFNRISNEAGIFSNNSECPTDCILGLLAGTFLVPKNTVQELANYANKAFEVLVFNYESIFNPESKPTPSLPDKHPHLKDEEIEMASGGDDHKQFIYAEDFDYIKDPNNLKQEFSKLRNIHDDTAFQIIFDKQNTSQKLEDTDIYVEGSDQDITPKISKAELSYFDANSNEYVPPIVSTAIIEDHLFQEAPMWKKMSDYAENLDLDGIAEEDEKPEELDDQLELLSEEKVIEDGNSEISVVSPDQFASTLDEPDTLADKALKILHEDLRILTERRDTYVRLESKSSIEFELRSEASERELLKSRGKMLREVSQLTAEIEDFKDTLKAKFYNIEVKEWPDKKDSGTGILDLKVFND